MKIPSLRVLAGKIDRRKFLYGLTALPVTWFGHKYLTSQTAQAGTGDSMLTILRSNERGLADHGWLKSRHTFSFADYYNPQQMGFRSLRVINEDRIAGGTGFPTHGHRDMEIISYVVKGALEHKDSQGNATTILPGEVQRMSAGTGVAHSEYNKQAGDETHFFQIWIQPAQKGLPFGYGQKSFEDDLKNKDIVLVISQDGREGSIAINQDANLYISKLNSTKTVEFTTKPGRHTWLQVVKGPVNVNGETLEVGDAISTSDEKSLKISATGEGEFMLFDLA